jgi:hypothetical protein
MKRSRFVYFISGFPLLVFSGFFTFILISIAIDYHPAPAAIVFATLFAGLVVYSLWLLKKWYTLGVQEMLNSDLVQSQSVVLQAVVTRRVNGSIREDQSTVVLDSTGQAIYFVTSDGKSTSLPFAALQRIRIKQFGIGVGRIFALDTTQGRFVFFLAESKDQKADIELHSLVGAIGSMEATAAGLLITALKHRDPSLVVMPETLDKLHFWFKKHMNPTKYSARFTRSMNGVLFMASFLPIMIAIGIVLEKFGSRIGLEDPAIIPGLLFVGCLIFGGLYVYVVYPRRFEV